MKCSLWSLVALAIALLTFPHRVGAQTQVGPDFFPDNPGYHLVNFDKDPSNNPISSGTALQSAYADYEISFDGNDRAVALDDYGASAPNQATGSADELQNINVYFNPPAEAAAAWGYDYVMRAFDVDGGLILQLSYSDGVPCPRPGNFREQRFLGIAQGEKAIYQVQFSRYFTDQVLCGFRIDDFQFIRQAPIEPCWTVPGNLQVAWNNCIGTVNSQSYVTFDCNNPAASYDLVGSFQVQSTFNNLVAIGVSMDVILDGQTSVAAFWHLESSGCNNGGVELDDNMPANCSGFITPWGPGGSSSDAVVIAYHAGYSAPNYGRLLGAVFRPSDTPTSLAPAPSRYYGFTMRLLMANSGSCVGCDVKASLRINSLTLFDDTPGDDPNPGAGYCVVPGEMGSVPCVTINDGGSQCDPLPARSTTWGRLKAVYR